MRDQSAFNEDNMAFYKQLREEGKKLNQRVTRLLSRQAVTECAKKLRMLKKGVLAFEEQMMMDVLMDYCIYNHRYRHGGQNTARIFADEARPSPGSLDHTLIQAMLGAWYSVFGVVEVIEDRGVILLDLLSEREIPLIDRGLGSTAVRYLMLAGRILPMPGFCMTAGAFLPLDPELMKSEGFALIERVRRSRHIDEHGRLAPGLEAAFAASMIRLALRSQNAGKVAYV